MTASAREPLAVIVAAQDARDTVVACLAAIQQQLAPGDRLLLLDASRDGTVELARRAYPHLTVITRPPGLLIPRLWRDGLGLVGESAVVLTTAHAVPEAGWLAALRAALAGDGVAAAGGAIEPAGGLGLVAWAIVLQRYSGFLQPLAAGPVTDVPGDNAIYRRAALLEVAETYRTGFWEPFVHAALRRRGSTIVCAPDAVVRAHRSYGAFAFAAQRYAHGCYFGALRAASESRTRRIARVAAGPLIPALWLWRIALRLRRKGRHGREFVLTLPFLLLFLTCWAAGEVVGTLCGLPPSAER